MAQKRRKGGFDPTFHRDGTVTFWSVYQQMWLRIKPEEMSDREYAALSMKDVERLERHKQRHKDN